MSPGSSLLTKQERKITAESVRAQLAAADAKGHCLPVFHQHTYPPAAKHHTLVNCVGLMAFLKNGFR